MQKQDIDQTFEAFNSFMTANRLKDAIEILALTDPGAAEYSDELSGISETYHNLVKYTIQGFEDPERPRIYKALQSGLYELSDRIKHKMLESSSMQLHMQKSALDQQAIQIREYIRDWIETNTFDSELNEIFAQPADEESRLEKDKKKKHLLSLLFAWLWFGGKLTESDKELVQKILKSERFLWHEKCLIISAVTMGLIKGFDLFRFEILFDTYEQNEFQISQRAFTGLMLGFYYYDHRLFLYPKLLNRLKAKQGDENFELDARTLIFQLFRAKDTEKVSKKFREEIMPDIVKHAPKLEDKLGLGQIIKDDPSEDKNPKWQKFFEDSPDLISKLEEITQMQMEGMDVFMSTFANLKHFPFFAQITNWFAPFYTEHKAVEDVFLVEEPRFRDVFIEGLNRSYYMCNSDKYSFCMSLGSMPSQQKEMMIQMFAAEVDGMKELEKEENILDSRRKINSIYTQYIQDLYRFFKLYPRRAELDDIFRQRFDFHNKSFMQHVLTSEKAWRGFADFYFEKEYFGEALEIYLKISVDGDPSQEVFEKIAYCYEKTGKLEQALVYYRKAELFDQNRVWNLRKIARCQWMLKNYQQAVATYKEAEQLEPENLNLQLTIGNCYLSLKDFAQALNYYYKVEMTSPDNQKVMRPIAWCLFVNGKLTEARHYYEKLMESDPNKYDFMNLGHVLLCMNQKQQAIDCYLQSLRQKDNSMQQFMAGFDDDRQYLSANGVEATELPVLIDYLKYSYEQQE
jgi:tetratricopeptide (TPR) repeat protein